MAQYKTKGTIGYGNVFASISEVPTEKLRGVTKSDLDLSVKRDAFYDGEVVYIEGELTDGTKISDFYVVLSGNLAPFSVVLESPKDNSRIVSKQPGSYYVEPDFALSLEELKTCSKSQLEDMLGATRFGRSSGVEKNYLKEEYEIETKWLISLFGLEAEYVSSNI